MPRGELERLRALQRVHRTFHASLELAELLPRVLGETAEVLEAEAGSLWLLDDTGQQLVCRVATGPVGTDLEGAEIPLGAGIVGAVTASRRPEIVADTSADRRFLFQVDQQTGFRTRSMVCAPLVIPGKCLGAIQILNCRSPEAFFEREDLELLEAIAADAAQALENARLFAVAQRAEDLAALLRLGRELTATLNTQALLETLAHSATALTGCDRAAVALLSGPTTSLRLAATAGPADTSLVERVRAAATRDEEWYLPDVGSATMADAGPQGVTDAAFHSPHAQEVCRSLLYLPLRDADGAVGALYVESARTEAFSLQQRELAGILAQQATVAIRNALLYNQVPLLSLRGRLRGAGTADARTGAKSRARRPLAWLTLALAAALVPWQYRVVAPFQLRPAMRVEVTAQTPGAVRRVFVREGESVPRGAVLAELEDRDVQREWTETEARRDLARLAMATAQAAGDAATYRQQLTTVRREEAGLALLARRRADASIRTPLTGVVLTPRLEERVGEVLSRGAPFCVVGAADPLDVEIRVPEERVPEVRVGQTVSMKLTALPGRRFRARVTRIGVATRVEAGVVSFPVICAIANPEGRFRPGQEGWAKISLGYRPLSYILLKRPWDRVRMGWWRLW